MNVPAAVTYKRILHLLAPTKKTARSQTALKHVKSSFRQSRQLPSDQQLKQLQIAQVYSDYLKDLKEYTDLIFAYNIGRTEKTQRQILESTAATTGLRLTEERME